MTTSKHFSVQGELNIFTVASLKASILDVLESASDVEIDLAGVTEIDTAGLQLMIMAKREAVEEGKELHFIQHSAAVVDLLDLYGLSGFFGDPIVIQSAQTQH